MTYPPTYRPCPNCDGTAAFPKALQADGSIKVELQKAAA
jgi:hypothetical protein